MHKIIFIVDEKSDGMILKDYLQNVKEMSSRTLTKLKNRENGLTRNGEHIRSVDKVNKGDKIALLFKDENTLKASDDVALNIIYEDDEYIACNKSGDIPSHPSLAHPNDTLANGVVAYLNKSDSLNTVHIINRLDKDTSGLVLVAKHHYAAALVTSDDNIKKKYYAVVCGKIVDDGTIELPIKREADGEKKRIVSSDGEYAATDYHVVKSAKDATLLEITLRTGRTHQIRVHFSAVGHPLVGDTLYGTPDENIKRQALHCKRMEFTNKISGKRVKLDCDFPDDFKFILKKYKLD